MGAIPTKRSLWLKGLSLLKPGRILRLVQWFRFPLVRTLRRSPAALFISVMTIAIAIKAFLPPMIEAARSLLRLLESTRRPGFIILLLLILVISTRLAVRSAYAWGWGWRWSKDLKFSHLSPEERGKRRGELLRFLYEASHGIPKKKVSARQVRRRLGWTMGELMATTVPLIEPRIGFAEVEETHSLLVLLWRGHRLALTAVGVLKVEEALEKGYGSIYVFGRDGTQVQVATVDSVQHQSIGKE